MPILYSLEAKLYKSTETIVKQVLLEIKEGTEGEEEVQTTINIAAGATEIIQFGGLSQAKVVIINAKTTGSTVDPNLVASLTNDTTNYPALATGAQEIRFGSRLVLLDTKATSLMVKNLDALLPVKVQVFILGV